jgi:hypothetical protein
MIQLKQKDKKSSEQNPKIIRRSYMENSTERSVGSINERKAYEEMRQLFIPGKTKVMLKKET